MARNALLAGTAALLVAAAVVTLVPLHSGSVVPTFPEPVDEPELNFGDAAAWQQFRQDALRRAKVWHEVDPAAVEVGGNPHDPSGLLSGDMVTCRFHPKPASGTTPKFRCVLTNGEVVRVKYGSRTGEIRAEVAAVRLLQALGFGVDEMYLIPRVRCYGCPRFPFRAVWTLDHVGASGLADDIPADRYTDFSWVSVERSHPGIDVAFEDDEGWRWDELAAIDPAAGASRAETDALRLAALFVAHWDNKASNQRLLCDGATDPSRCDEVLAFIHDLGATFGPNKIDLDAWRNAPIWLDRSACTVSMKTMPYDGGTFPDTQISEPGRALLARQLKRLTDAQIASLFAGARIPEFRGGDPATQLEAWTAAFKARVDDIVQAGPCPTPAGST